MVGLTTTSTVEGTLTLFSEFSPIKTLIFYDSFDDKAFVELNVTINLPGESPLIILYLKSEPLLMIDSNSSLIWSSGFFQKTAFLNYGSSVLNSIDIYSSFPATVSIFSDGLITVFLMFNGNCLKLEFCSVLFPPTIMNL